MQSQQVTIPTHVSCLFVMDMMSCYCVYYYTSMLMPSWDQLVLDWSRRSGRAAVR